MCRFLDEVVFPYRKPLSRERLKQRKAERAAIMTSRQAQASASSAALQTPHTPMLESSNNNTRKKRKLLTDSLTHEDPLSTRALEIAGEIRCDLTTARKLAKDDMVDIEGIDAAVGEEYMDEEGLPALDDGPLSYNTVDSWMAAISETHSNQKAMGLNCQDSFRGGAFKAKMDSLKSLQVCAIRL